MVRSMVEERIILPHVISACEAGDLLAVSGLFVLVVIVCGVTPTIIMVYVLSLLRLRLLKVRGQTEVSYRYIASFY